MEEKSISTCTRRYREIGYGVEKNNIEKRIVGGIAVGYIDGVYEPGHDSEILLKSVDHVIELGTARLGVLLEIGSGTGYVSAKLMFKYDIGYAILIDIDPKAVYSSWKTVKMNEIDWKVDVIQCDGASCIRREVVDLVYFNPPYLPICDDIPEAIAWNGGENGLEVWSRFFRDSLSVCKKGCTIVFIMSTLQKVDELLKYILNYEYVEVLNCEHFFYEMICGIVVKIF
jgi:HemK-related putative methylase